MRSLSVRLSIGILVTASLLVLMPKRSQGEAFIDLFIGAARTENAELTAETQILYGTGDVGFANSVSGGVRGGYWFDNLPWLGVAASFSYFQPDLEIDGGDLTMRVIPASALVMFRAPIAPTAEYPAGPVYPYVAFGPAVFVSDIDEPGAPDATADLGVDAHAGVAIHVGPVVSLFAEYRLTYYNAQFEEHSWYDSHHGDDWYAPYSLDTDLTTHHFLVGVSFPIGPRAQ